MSADLINRLLSLANSDSRAGEPLGKCMREAALEIERLQKEVAHWKGLYEDEKRDHEATIKHAERDESDYFRSPS